MNAAILDLDGAARGLAGARVLPLRQHEQRLRFACSTRALRDFAHTLDARLPVSGATVLTGSGDFHHLSLPLIERVARHRGPLQVVVFDNHPDNMRFPFGVHCGSWISHACAIAGVRHVHVVGITSEDIGWRHAWENRWRPLRAGRLSYWSCGVDTRWARAVGLAPALHDFEHIEDLVRAFAAHMDDSDDPVYLSVDKDVLSTGDVHTNWDQGCMRESQLCELIAALDGRIVGSDITGEVSVVHYRQRWKRLLSALDGQSAIRPEELAQWQSQHRRLNARLLAAIARATDAATAPSSA